MAKVVMATIASLQDESTALSQLSSNFTQLASALEQALSRDGLNYDGSAVTDNAILSDIDVNNYRIINLPPPTDNTEPARHGDIATYVTDAQTAATAAQAAQSAAEAAAGATLGGVTGDILVYNSATPAWEPQAPYVSLNSDVDTTGVSDGEVLVYNSASGKWIPGAAPASSSKISIQAPHSDYTTSSLIGTGAFVSSFFYARAGEIITGMVIPCQTASGTCTAYSGMFSDSSATLGTLLASNTTGVTGMVVGPNWVPFDTPYTVPSDMMFWGGVLFASAGLNVASLITSDKECAYFSCTPPIPSTPTSVTYSKVGWGSMFPY